MSFYTKVKCWKISRGYKIVKSEKRRKSATEPWSPSRTFLDYFSQSPPFLPVTICILMSMRLCGCLVSWLDKKLVNHNYRASTTICSTLDSSSFRRAGERRKKSLKTFQLAISLRAAITTTCHIFLLIFILFCCFCTLLIKPTRGGDGWNWLGFACRF